MSHLPGAGADLGAKEDGILTPEVINEFSVIEQCKQRNEFTFLQWEKKKFTCASALAHIHAEQYSNLTRHLVSVGTLLVLLHVSSRLV